MQEQLWNKANDELKENESKVVEAYEKILSAILGQNDSESVAPEPMGNEIEKTQLQQLIHIGLARTQEKASIQQDIDKWLQAVQGGKE